MRAILSFLLVCTMVSPVLAEKAEEIDPKAEAQRSFKDGLFWLQRSKYEKAQKKFAEAIDAQPKLAEAYNNYAYCARKVSAENYEESLQYYNKALELKPTLAVAYQYRGCLHVLMGNKDLAIADYRKLVRLDRELASSLEVFIKTDGKTDKEDGFAVEY